MGRKINIKKRETHEKTLEIERGDEGEVRAVGEDCLHGQSGGLEYPVPVNRVRLS